MTRPHRPKDQSALQTPIKQWHYPRSLPTTTKTATTIQTAAISDIPFNRLPINGYRMAQQYVVVSHSLNEQLSLLPFIAFHTSDVMSEFTMKSGRTRNAYDQYIQITEGRLNCSLEECETTKYCCAIRYSLIGSRLEGMVGERSCLDGGSGPRGRW